ncbi:hypothetical protein JHK85_040215 [Glycine max]|nr:hypothetical protein JHK85_040215 [Glycine max]
MLTEQLIGSTRFHEINELLHGMMADNGAHDNQSCPVNYFGTRNLPIGREVATILASGQVYMQALNKGIEDAQREANTHTIIEFNQRDTQFLVQETINSREVWPIGDFTVRQDERWCGYDKFQKLYMSYSHVVATCKQAHHEYRNYIHSVYTLESMSNIYRGLLKNCAMKCILATMLRANDLSRPKQEKKF